MKKLYVILFFSCLLAVFILCKSRVDSFMATVICSDQMPKEKVLVKATQSYTPTMLPETVQNIPRVIIQTNEKDKIPLNMERSNATIISKNPDYQYIYFNNKRARQYLADNYPPSVVAAYDKLKPGAYKADLFRYCYLYKNGGVYIDTGMIAVTSLNNIIKAEDEFLSPEDNETGGLYNAFICCSPQHPILKTTLDETLKNIAEENYGKEPLDITGPTVFARAFERVTGRNVLPNTKYGKGIRTLRYKRLGFCNTAGKIWDGSKEVFVTRYPTYHIDRMWYNKHKHYSDMWRARDVFRNISLEQHQDDLMLLLAKFMEFANRYKLVWWASGGTLLGAIREGNIIEWDDDIDLDIPKDAIEFLKTKKEELKLDGMMLDYDDRIWRIRFTDSRKAYIDLFEMERIGDVWDYTDKFNKERWPNAYSIDSEIMPLKSYKFGRLMINGPANPEPYLTRQYGDWRTPVKMKGHHDF